MKKGKFIVLLCMLSVALSLSLSSAYSEEDSDGKAGHNGSPGEQTCSKSGCHDSFALNSGPGAIEIDVPGMTNWQYVPGQTYTINVTVSQANRSLFGFGFEALLNSGANAGTLTAGPGSHALNATVLGNSRRTITHLEDAGATANAHTFSFTWVAPATAVPVTFYAAGNAANNNGGDSNDYIYTTSQALTALVAPNAPTISANADTDLCNGESVTLSVVPQSGVTYNWFNDQNQNVGTGASILVDEEGCFTVTAVNGAGSVQSVNEVCTTLNLVDASFSGLESFYCLSSQPVTLSAIDPTGVFSGDGINGNLFDPQLAGVGSHVITHTLSGVGGCTDVVQQLVEVGFSASPSFELPAQTLCETAEALVPVPLNTGGVFSGEGVENGVFNPSVGAGLYEITYTIGEQNCVQASVQTVEVLPAPDAYFTGLELEYCSNADAQLLVPAVVTGEFQGPGIVGSSFSPAGAGAGVHLISHVVLGENGCTALSTQTVEINEAVSAEFGGLDQQYCENDAPTLLIPVDEGGVFSIEAAEGFFDPSIGEGEYEVVYTNGVGSCEVTSSQSVLVLAAPDASFTGLLSGYCTNADPVLLNGTGVFEGPGVAENVFNPAAALIGENTISHSVTGLNGCSNSVQQTVLVFETANSNFSGLPEEACPVNETIALIAENQGGTFSGPGVQNGIFNPSLAGPGVHVVQHVVDLVGCFSVSTDTVLVFDQPVVNITGLQPSYCEDDASAILFADQGNALFEGPGVIENFFQPALAGPGIHQITCSFTTDDGCVGGWSSDVEVIALPDATVDLDGNTLIALEQNGSFSWFDCASQAVLSDAGGIFTPLVSGTYAVEIELSGCNATSDCIEVIITGQEEVSNEGLMLFPNPAVDRLNVLYSHPFSVSVFGPAGNLVFSKENLNGQLELDVQQWSPGIYLLRIEHNKRSETRYFMVGR
jgi:hypothetical protein